MDVSMGSWSEEYIGTWGDASMDVRSLMDAPINWWMHIWMDAWADRYVHVWMGATDGSTPTSERPAGWKAGQMACWMTGLMKG